VSFKVSLLVSSLALMVPALGLSTTVSLNNICVTPNCMSPDTLNSGQSTGSSLNTIWTLPNGDQYYVSGFYGASYMGGTVNIAADPAAQYIGNITNHGAMSQNDILTFNFYQNYNFMGDPSGYYAYFGQSTTTGTLGAGSSYTLNLSWNGIQIGPSTYGTGYSGTNLFNQRYYTTSELSATPLAADEFISMYFAAGSDPGASFATVTPEPASILLLSMGGLMLLGFAVKNARQRKSEVLVP
jgi:hypothetical protein